MVVIVGPGQRNENGQKIPMSAKCADYVVLPDYGGTKIGVLCLGILAKV